MQLVGLFRYLTLGLGRLLGHLRVVSIQSWVGDDFLRILEDFDCAVQLA
jgi:hypothetical protein